MINKGIVALIMKASRLLIGASGVVALFMTVNYVLKRAGNLSHTIVNFSTYSFGVYILQQFVLKYLYYNTELPYIVSAYFLPWISFLISLLVSFLLTYLFRKTNIGRNLIR